MIRTGTIFGSVAAAMFAWWGQPAQAQAQAAGGFIAEATAEGPANCPVVTLRFTVPVRFTGLASAGASEARLRVEPAARGAVAVRDMLSGSAGTGLIRSVAWERDAPGGAMLIVAFTTPTGIEVGLGNDSQSIVLDLENKADSSGCSEPVTPSVASPQEALDAAELGRLQAQAEEALLRKDDESAGVALDRILAARDNSFTPRAIELRGLVHERRGEQAQARERYQEYLRRFPADAGAGRVRQRIAGLPSAAAATAQDDKGAGRWRATMSGSSSQFYSRDESRNRFIDARRVDPQEEIDHRINIDQLLSTLDLSASLTNGRTRISTRVSGSYTHDFRPVTLVGSSRSAGNDTARIYELYVDASDEPSGLSGRIGRQSLFGSGVFGRFDGVRLGWQANPALEIHAQAGFPLHSPRTDRVIRDRWFYGLSVGYAPPDAKYGMTAYWYDQHSHGLVDRRAIGIEGRYTTKGIALFGLADVDVMFGKLSHLFLSATVPMAGGASLSLQADQQYYPPLSLTNAVIGQPVPRLEELKRQFDEPTLRQLAKDRSARSRNLTLTYTKPLSERWTAQLDLTLASIGRTPASAGVEAIPGSGTEFYGGGQLVGNGIFVAGDTLITGLRYASTERFHIVDGELAARVPVGSKLAIEPRLRVARRTDKFGPGHQTAWRPNLRATYQATRWIAFDAEVGLVYFRQRQDDAAFVGKNRERATLLNLGYRLTF